MKPIPFNKPFIIGRERLLRLPLHYDMDDADVARISATTRQFFTA